MEKQIIGGLERVVNKILFLKKKSIFQFEDVKFFPSEVHLMLFLKGMSATNVTSIANQLGVTKGAVSQSLARLEKKGVLTKTKDPYNKNELTLTFTEFGNKAFYHYEKHAKTLEGIHLKYIATYTDEEKAVIRRFLKDMDQAFEKIF